MRHGLPSLPVVNDWALMTTVSDRSQIAPATSFRPRRLPLSSQVVPSLFVGLDSFAILSSGLVAYAIIVGSSPDPAGYYGVAMSFVWLTTLILMNFAGLYKFEPLMRSLTYADKIIVSFVTTFLFLMAAAFAVKISATFAGSGSLHSPPHLVRRHSTLRILASVILNRVSNMRVFTREVVVAGSGNQIARLLDYMTHQRPPFVSVVGFC